MITATVNMTEFKRDLRKLAAMTSSTLPQFFNSRAYIIAKTAMGFTGRASRAGIEKLAVAGYRIIKSRKTGAFRRGAAIYNANGIAGDIIQGRRHRRGEKPLTRAELIEPVRKMISARLRSIAFLASGWIPALRKLDKFAAVKAVGTDGARQRGQAKGRAIAAKDGFNIFAQIENNATPEGDNRRAAETMMTSALQRAMAQEHAEMRMRLADKIAKEARKMGATVR